MLKNIPKDRLLIYLLVAGLLPIVLALFLVFSMQRSVSDMRMQIRDIEQAALIQEKKQAVNTAVKQHFSDADHFYIDKYLETLNFLEPEVETLQKIQSNTHFAEDDSVKKRLELLTGTGNSMVFSESAVQSTPLFQEVIETLVHPVEINAVDLQKVLAKVEGIKIGPFTPGPNRPQLIITDFKLDRKVMPDKNEVFVLNLKLLKREFQ